MRGGRSELVLQLGVLLCRAARATPGKPERHAARRASESPARRKPAAAPHRAHGSLHIIRRGAPYGRKPAIQAARAATKAASLPLVRPSLLPRMLQLGQLRAASALALRLRRHLSSASWVLTAHLQPGKGGCRSAYRLRYRRRGRWEGRRIRIDKQLSALSRRRSDCATARARCDACARSKEYNEALWEARPRRHSSSGCLLPCTLIVAGELSH
jgi:hypothetical protein